MQRLLFVYGTLMQALAGEWGSRLQARRLGRGWFRGRLYDLGSHPGAVLEGAREEERVFGELYELADPDHALATLDEHEDCFPADPARSLFLRRLVAVEVGGRWEQAWVYVYNRGIRGARRITSGDYRQS